MPLLWYCFGADQGFVSYCVWAWREFGVIPYRDIFEQNFPGIFLIDYLAQLTLGPSMAAFRSFDLAWQMTAALLIFIISVRFFQSSLAGFIGAGLYSIYYIGLGPWHTTERDGLLLMPYLMSFVLVASEAPARAKIWKAGLAGLCMGFAFIIKPVALPAMLVFAAMILRQRQSRTRRTLVFAISSALPFLACVFCYWRIGALHDFVQCLFVYTSRVYIDHGLATPGQIINGLIMRDFLPNNVLMLAGAVLVFFFRKRLRLAGASGVTWLLLILLATYLGYFFQGKSAYKFYYHQAPVWGMVCLFAGLGWAAFIQLLNDKWPGHSGLISASIVAALILAALGMIKPENKTFLAGPIRSGSEKIRSRTPYYVCARTVSDYIRLHSGPEDRVQVWGGDVVVNYFARRRAATRFATTLHMIPFRPGAAFLSPLQKQMGEQMLGSLKSSPPKFFVVSTLGYINMPSCKQALVEDYPEIWAFLNEKYQIQETECYLEIYSRKN